MHLHKTQELKLKINRSTHFVLSNAGKKYNVKSLYHLQIHKVTYMIYISDI